MEPDPAPCQGPLEVPGECLGSAFTPLTGSMSPKSLLSLRELFECMEVLTRWLTRREGRHGECGELEHGSLLQRIRGSEHKVHGVLLWRL